MSVINLKAHFDGTSIHLDEPYELAPNTQLLVTILPPCRDDAEREDWARLAVEGLARAYGDDEPDYFSADILP